MKDQALTTPDPSRSDAAEEGAPVRILDIIRTIETPATQAIPAIPVSDPATEAYPLPHTAPIAPGVAEAGKTPAAAEASIPSLAELGGHVTGQQGATIDSISDLSEIVQNPAATMHPNPQMEVYAADLPKDAPLPPSREDIDATHDSPLQGIVMDKIKLEASEPKTPKTFSTSVTPESAEEPVADAIPAPKAGSGSEFIIPSVHTLRDDMKTVVQDQSMSIVHASALEQEKKHARQLAVEEASKEKTARKHSGSGKGIIVAIFVFILLGLLLGGGFLWYRANEQSPLAVASAIPSLIFAEQSIPFALSNSSPSVLKSSLAGLRTGNTGGPGSITHINATIATNTSIGGTSAIHTASPQEFFAAIGAQLPADLTSSIGTDFFLGVHATDGNQVLIIIPITSYEHAFAGMLAWEPNMGDDLSPFIERAPGTLTAADGSSAANTFKDIVIKNYDVRMQVDAGGNPKLLYSFPNRNLLIITSSQYTLVEALARLQAARKL